MTRRRTRSGFWRGVTVALVIVAAFGAIPATSFTESLIPRSGSIDVVSDQDGTLGLDVATSARKNKQDPLVTVTNNFGAPTSVTVSLDDGTQGDLYVNGVNTGDVATVTLPAGGVQTVEIVAEGTPNTQLSFDVSATSLGVTATFPNRVTTIASGGGGGPPGGGGGGPPGGGGGPP